MSRLLKQCYICGAEGNTREHVPPLSFFPNGFRTNLWTVRSCEQHNIGNSKEVEYVRNVIVTHRNSKGTAKELAQSAAFRSFERSAALFFQTFKGATSMVVDGKPKVVPMIDKARFEHVMKAIACGLCVRERSPKRYEGDWHFFSPALLSDDSEGRSSDGRRIQNLISATPYTPVATPEPTVFKYGRFFDGGLHASYQFEFYGGFLVYIWSRGRRHSISI